VVTGARQYPGQQRGCGRGHHPAQGRRARARAGPLAFALGFELGLDGFRGRTFEVAQRELWGVAETRLRMPLDWVLPFVAVRGGVGWVHQAFTRDRERRPGQ
jgi:hypothetical protein